MAVHFDKIVPWGRLRGEYDLMFDLSAQDLSDGVLDCGGGPSSFTAELSASGFRAVSVDPIYTCSESDIRARFEAIADSMLSQIRMTPDDWTWSYHRSPEELLAARRKALERFLADYESGLDEGRYLVGELPSLPFPSASFGLAVCSHLLFLYSDLLSEDFHIRAVRELCRVGREARIFPLLTQSRQPSPHVAAVRSALDADGYLTEVVQVSIHPDPLYPKPDPKTHSHSVPIRLFYFLFWYEGVSNQSFCSLILKHFGSRVEAKLESAVVYQ